MENKDYENIIKKEVARHLEDSGISKLSHFFAAERFEIIHKYYIGLPTTVAALLLSWLVAQKDLETGGNSWIFPIKITLSLIVAISTGISTFLNFNELASQHRKSALRYQDIWRKCKNWETDFPDETDLVSAKKIIRSYRKDMTEINQESPQIPKWAYNSVNKQMKAGSISYNNE